ncbi:MAG: hypothetical protein NUV31_04040 [Dehalococcoidales bacterium]|nr:hypothetical protein [Dehalococcoidales bacterium]
MGRYAHSPIVQDMQSENYFRYPGIIDRVEINMERPTDDMDLMLEIEQAHHEQ